MGLFFYMVDVLEDFSAIKTVQMTVIPTGSWLSLPLAAQSVSRKSARSVTRCLPLSLQGNILFYDYEYILMDLFFYIIDILGWFIPNKVFKWPWSQLAADCRLFYSYLFL